jgi:hypothetical protein
MGIKIHIMSNCVHLVQLMNKVPMFVLVIYELTICYTLCVFTSNEFQSITLFKTKKSYRLSILYMKILEEQ